MNVKYDSVGKMDLTDVYNRESPLSYFSVLSGLDYCVAENARRGICDLIEARRALSGHSPIRLIDVGCSYGINAALLKYGFSFEDLARHYESMEGRARSTMIEEDASFFARPVDDDLMVIGIDTAHRALQYAIEAGVIDEGAAVDLEAEDPPENLRNTLLSNADFVISTGCFGYITERTLNRILDCSRAKAPWMCHTVLRMFDFSDAADALAERGYVTERVDGLIRQRRFASPEEQEQVLANLVHSGIDPTGLETDGWYYAQMYISRPAADAHVAPLGSFMSASQHEHPTRLDRH